MRDLRRALTWATLAAVLVLGVLSIVGAFLGAELAAELFTSVPAAIGCVLLVALFAFCVAASPRPLRTPGQVALHLGPLLVLLGGLWASQPVQRLSGGFGERPPVPSGYVVLEKGQPSDLVISRHSFIVGHLPFELKLDAFHVLYYEGKPWHLVAVLPAAEQGGQPRMQELDRMAGSETTLPSEGIRIRVLAYETKGRLVREDGEPVGLAPDPKSTVPAAEVEIEADGRTERRYLLPDPDTGLARVPLSKTPDANGLPALFLASPPRMPRQYESDVTVLRSGQPVAQAVIRVNKPFHYGGYYFYQHSYDTSQGLSSVLRVTPDRGLTAIRLGFLLLGAGVCWVCWVVPGVRRLRRRAADGS